MASNRDSGPIFLFDVDGTLTKPRQKIEPCMSTFLDELKTRVKVGIVGGSDLVKIKEQVRTVLFRVGDGCTMRYDYVFAENGLVAYRGGVDELPGESIVTRCGETHIRHFIDFCLRYISDADDVPIKRGNFIEFRRGMINVSPIGRNCSQTEREAFVVFDTASGMRQRFVDALRERFPVAEYGLHFSIGGQISVDAFPVGWDKTYCLAALKKDGVGAVHFFGDRTAPNGNDHEIFAHADTVGYTVADPADTRRQVADALATLKL